MGTHNEYSTADVIRSRQDEARLLTGGFMNIRIRGNWRLMYEDSTEGLGIFKFAGTGFQRMQAYSIRSKHQLAIL